MEQISENATLSRSKIANITGAKLTTNPLQSNKKEEEGGGVGEGGSRRGKAENSRVLLLQTVIRKAFNRWEEVLPEGDVRA